jgi:S-adenosylmethionine uptake transporter
MNTHRFLKKKNYIIAALWIVLVNTISVSNDVISCFMGQSLHPFQVAFMRFFISAITVIPFMIHRKTFYFKTKMIKMHFWRTFLGTIAIGLGTISVLKFRIVCNTSIMFSEPILFLPLAAIFLKEKIDATRWICTVVGLTGIAVVLYKDIFSWNSWFFVPLFSAFFFAVICVIAKKMVCDEHILTLLFYFGIGAALLTLIPAIMVWQPMTLSQIAYLTLLGCNANLIQICMFKAYAISEAAPLMPLRYLEFIISLLAGLMFFQQKPDINTLIGCFIIISSSIAITIAERRKERAL